MKHSHKKRKDSLETRGVLLIFSLELETSGVAVQSIHQNSKELLSENEFEAILATCCCYDHGAKASEEDQKKYRKCSWCVIIC